MRDFISFKDAMEKSIVNRAKNLAWDACSEEQQKAFLKQAKEDQDISNMKLAKKCMDEAEAAFSAPGFVSRADPAAYSDYKKTK